MKDKGANQRLGAWPCKLKKGTKAHEAYGADNVSERHRHRYEVNNDFVPKLDESGLVISGTSPDGNIVEVIEWPDGFGVGTQAHPELRSRPNHAHPLFRGLVGAALDRQAASRLFEVPEPADV